MLLQFNQSNISDDLRFEKTFLTIRRNLDQQSNLALKVKKTLAVVIILAKEHNIFNSTVYTYYLFKKNTSIDIK